MIYEPETHIICQKITRFHIYPVIYCITVCYTNHYRDMTLKTLFQNFHITFLNSDISVDNESNVTKSVG